MHERRPDDTQIHFPVPLVGFAAFSGTGKTTLLLQLVPMLKQRGLRLAVVKHAHHSFDMDYAGKDSYRLREAGADEMLVAARCRFGLIRECRDAVGEPSLREALGMLDPERLDLVLVEGFKHEPIPKIELHRPALGRPLLFPHDPHIIAIASDNDHLAQAPLHIPRLALNSAEQIADFVLDFIGRRPRAETGLAG
ncbi:MAG: molybdopterin-guanine dinucleotide biosynthesis protein B [Gammaproteobacteria bacterium]|nr:molybdopterin-guanine dinucleotide biosynthesis protein B [Gammaproteobacteria bacterium]